jgi:hypothetical protein
MAHAAPEYPRTNPADRAPKQAGDGVVETTTEARQGVTGHNARYVLLFSLGGVVVAFVLIYAIFLA